MANGILATGSYVGTDVITNAMLADWTGQPEDWFEERTGVRTRVYAPDDMLTSELAHRAVLDMQARHPGALDDVSLILVGTSTPDSSQPAMAAVLQGALGLSPVPAYDINAVCASFVFALDAADAHASHRIGPNVLVVGVDKYSKIIRRTDRRTATLFGDGAGAVLLGPVPDDYGILASRLAAHGEHADKVRVPPGGLFEMDGRATTNYVLTQMPALIEAVLADAGVTLDQVARIVLHQANPNLLLMLAAKLGIDPWKVPLTGTFYGNTGAASVPVTLTDTHTKDPIQRGDLVLFGAIGGGYTSGVMLCRWW